MGTEHSQPPATAARRLMRSLDTASLATLLLDEGWPYASLVLVASDIDGSPLLLLSSLAEHSRNIARDARVSLLFDGTSGHDSRLTGPRVTVLGRAASTTEPRHRARFLARHPDAGIYVDFRDFAFYRVAVERAHLVAGFGAIHWIAGSELLPGGAGDLPVAAAEAEVVEHMNSHHADAVQLLARASTDAAGEGWIMTGCDPEGADLRRGGTVLRLWFDKPVRDAEGARAELVRLVKRARQAGSDMPRG